MKTYDEQSEMIAEWSRNPAPSIWIAYDFKETMPVGQRLEFWCRKESVENKPWQTLTEAQIAKRMAAIELLKPICHDFRHEYAKYKRDHVDYFF